jgi:hypothetical protein
MHLRLLASLATRRPSVMAGAVVDGTRGGPTRQTSSLATIDASKPPRRRPRTGFDGYVDYIEDRLQITRPQRSPNPSSAT